MSSRQRVNELQTFVKAAARARKITICIERETNWRSTKKKTSTNQNRASYATVSSPFTSTSKKTS